MRPCAHQITGAAAAEQIGRFVRSQILRDISLATTMPLADVVQAWSRDDVPGERTVLVP